MTKIQRPIALLFFFLLPLLLRAQENFPLHIRVTDADTLALKKIIPLKTHFNSRIDCQEYISRLPSQLQSHGYISASVDSVLLDEQQAFIVVFIGEPLFWALLDTRHIDDNMLRIAGWRRQDFDNKPLDFSVLTRLEDQILLQYENSGYPFARVYLDSIRTDSSRVFANLKTDPGPLYHVDSIRLYGNVRITRSFLEHYLDLPPGSVYNAKKLKAIPRKIADLPYVEEYQPASLTRLADGSVLNLYLKPKRSSQVNFLIGFLPNNDQLSTKKLLLTGEANINLKNALGSGETIGINWQQLQLKSPRLNIVYQQPYLFKSPLGLDFNFDIFHKDSTWLNINMQLGAQYAVGNTRVVRVFANRFQTIVNGVNTPLILLNRQLPVEGDVSSLNGGVDYEFNNTDYRLNPRSGSELKITTSGGSKKIKKNNQIVNLKDPADPSFDFSHLYDTVKLKTFQFRIRASAAHYFSLGKGRTVLRTALNTGLFTSGRIFRNELFQLGGFKLLRGFDEESEYLSSFAIGTLEYRLLLQRNSYFYVLADGGWGQRHLSSAPVNHTYLGTGIGLAFDSKAGIFNIALGLGKRDDTDFNLRKAKIHFGFVNYF